MNEDRPHPAGPGLPEPKIGHVTAAAISLAFLAVGGLFMWLIARDPRVVEVRGRYPN
jgi:hypothetical protein